MSGPGKARRNLPYVDPVKFTSHFAWKTGHAGSTREVFCEDVSLEAIASRYGTPTYVYSQRAVEDAFDEFESGLKRLPHLLCCQGQWQPHSLAIARKARQRLRHCFRRRT
jgi:hypothetical protein